MKTPEVLSQFQARWRTLDAREQTLATSALLLVGLALIWWLLVAPPLRTLRTAEAQQISLDVQLQKMQALQAQAQALQTQTKLGRDEAVRALEASVKQRLGPAGQLAVVGDRATVTLRNVPADALAQWLAQARVNARAIPGEVRLVRSTLSTQATPGNAISAANAQVPAAAPTPTATAGNAPAWDGTLVMSLPPQ